LEGKPADLVFEKTNNTFAQRHHLRLWRVRGAIEGKPVWVGAATHDTAIVFSEAEHFFVHRIDPHVDREREKLTDDLIFTRRAKAFGMFERPKGTLLPIQNAVGEPIETDGRIVALLLD
jgi:LssY C-terminus